MMKAIKKVLIVILIIVAGVAYSYGTWPRAIFNTNIGSLSYEKTDFLTTGSIVEQNFVCASKGFSGFTIKLLKQDGQQLGDYDWSVQEVESGDVIAEGTIGEKDTQTRLFQSSMPQKQGMIQVEIPRQENSKGKEYKLTLKATEMQDTESAAVYMTEKGNVSSELKVNGEVVADRASIVKADCKRFNVETFIVFWGIGVYLWVFIKFMYKLFK